MIELVFLKILMLIRHVHQKGVIFVTTGTFQINGLNLNQMSAGVKMYQ